MSRLISRDPFAREELHRDTARGWSAMSGCAECGRVMRTPRHGDYYLYRYSIETDGGRTFTDSHLFCSKGCRDAYHS